MATIIMINPASGDDTANLLTGTDSSDTILDTVEKGTMFKVIGSSGKFYTVEYDNGEENVTKGGSGSTGTVVAYPYIAMYNDTKKTTQIGNVNNGTACVITDDSAVSMMKIYAYTTEGYKEGYVDSKYIYRDKTEEDEAAESEEEETETEEEETETD